MIESILPSIISILQSDKFANSLLWVAKIIVLLFFFNPVIGQKIKVVDSQNDPIYNVGFFKKDQTKAKFSNFKGEVDLSEFKDNDTIFVQHPTFENKNIVKSLIKKNILILQTKIINIDKVVFQTPIFPDITI